MCQVLLKSPINSLAAVAMVHWQLVDMSTCWSANSPTQVPTSQLNAELADREFNSQQQESSHREVNSLNGQLTHSKSQLANCFNRGRLMTPWCVKCILTFFLTKMEAKRPLAACSVLWFLPGNEVSEDNIKFCDVIPRKNMTVFYFWITYVLISTEVMKCISLVQNISPACMLLT